MKVTVIVKVAVIEEETATASLAAILEATVVVGVTVKIEARHSRSNS